ncbi:MAG: hypothetical protein ACOH17_08815 [Cellulomonas sp.]
MRRPAPRIVALVLVVVIVVAGAVAYGISAFRTERAQVASAPPVAQSDLSAVEGRDRIVFRSTAPGDQYGLVAMVPLDDPSGPRAFTSVACDRIDAVPGAESCLRTVRGIATRFEAQLLDASWHPVQTWPLPGVPSRTRLSADGSLLATTSFVTGHSYATTGFSTQTVVHRADGTTSGDLETFGLTVDGKEFTGSDRNLWGVTFVDDTTFYATAASAAAGKTWLVKGSLADRTLVSLHENVECPSLSPDGTRIAFKKNVGTGGATFWSVAVLDLATGTEVVAGEKRSIDDQIEWLDSSTLLYGMPRETEPGVTDVWSVAAQAGATPRVFIPQAWSPSVVRN